MRHASSILPGLAQCVRGQLLSCICDPTDCSLQAPLFMEFSRQEYWSGLPFPTPGDLSDPGIEPESPALAGDSLPTLPPRRSHCFASPLFI